MTPGPRQQPCMSASCEGWCSKEDVEEAVERIERLVYEVERKILA